MENVGDQDKQNYEDYDKYAREVAKRCIPPFDHGDSNSLSSSNTQYMPYKKFFGHYRGTKEQFYHSSESSIWDTKSYDSSAKSAALPTKLPDAIVMKKKLKKLDKVNVDKLGNCTFTKTSGLTNTLRFLVTDPGGQRCRDRLVSLLKTLKQQSQNGFNITELEDIVFILDYLVDMRGRDPILRSICDDIMLNLKQPIMMERASDVDLHAHEIQLLFMWLGYALAYISDDNLHRIVAESLCQHFTGKWNAVEGSVKSNYCLAAGAQVILCTTTKMICLASSGKLPQFLKIALIIARKSEEIGLEMMHHQVLQCLFYRLNPNFPDDLNFSYINPKNPQDPELKLDFRHDNMSRALSLMLTVLQQASEYLVRNPGFLFPCPDQEAQRLFIWVFRYECRARDHKHQRKMLLGVVMGLLKVFGDKLTIISCDLMLDILSLSVHTEVPVTTGWLADVHFNTSRIDVEFKKLLIKCSVKFLQMFPGNRCFVKVRQWMLGIVYLMDPQLYSLRKPWTSAVHQELSVLAMQALICTLPICEPGFVSQLHITSKTLWFIESYENERYSMELRYWSLRLLRVCNQCETREGILQKSQTEEASTILMNAVKMLLNEPEVLLEREQVILAICCCMLTDYNSERVEELYSLLNSLLTRVLRIIRQNGNISERLLVSLLDAIWEIIIWNPALRARYVSENGVYKILDICSRHRYAIQSICLAMLCDILRDGLGVAQVVTWRAGPSSLVVPRGAHVAELLAACSRAECHRKGIGIDEVTNAITNLDYPFRISGSEHVLFQRVYKQEMLHVKRSNVTLSLLGSRTSKTCAILQMLSLDLCHKVDIADETYKLYKDIKLKLKDECILLMCYYYMTCKIDEAWQEGVMLLSRAGMPYQKDLRTLSEFTKLSRNWSKELRALQDDIIAKKNKKLEEQEASLYKLLRSCRLSTALKALKEVQCQARTSDRTVLINERLADAVNAVNRRRRAESAAHIELISSYVSPIDNKNKTGQYMTIKDSCTGKLKERQSYKLPDASPASPGSKI